MNIRKESFNIAVGILLLENPTVVFAGIRMVDDIIIIHSLPKGTVGIDKKVKITEAIESIKLIAPAMLAIEIFGIPLEDNPYQRFNYPSPAQYQKYHSCFKHLPTARARSPGRAFLFLKYYLFR